MFQRVNDKQNQDKQPDPEIREEQKAEFGGIGNEAIGNLITNDDPDGMLGHYLTNDLNRKDSGKGKKKDIGIIGNIMNDEKNIMNEDDDSRIEDEPLDHYAANDLNRKDKKKKKRSRKISLKTWKRSAPAP